MGLDIKWTGISRIYNLTFPKFEPRKVDIFCVEDGLPVVWPYNEFLGYDGIC